MAESSYRYYFVREYGAFGYASLAVAGRGQPVERLYPGFGVAVSRVAQQSPERRFALTSHDHWAPLDDLREARVSTFRGVALQAGQQVA